MGVFPCKALTSKRLLRPLTALTSHKQHLHPVWNTKCGAVAKALMPSPFVYFISLHINSQ